MAGYFMGTAAVNISLFSADKILEQAQIINSYATYGTFIFGISFPIFPIGVSVSIPPPTRLRCEIENKLVEIPIIGMDGNRLQHLGRQAPRVVFEGYFLHPIAKAAEATFLNMTKVRTTLPFFTSLLSCYRMMHLKRFVTEPTKTRDIKYTIELWQDEEYGYP